MSDHAHVRTPPGYDLRITPNGDYTHIFGRDGEPLCGRAMDAEEGRLGRLCRNCRHFAELLGLVAGEAGGKA